MVHVFDSIAKCECLFLHLQKVSVFWLGSLLSSFDMTALSTIPESLINVHARSFLRKMSSCMAYFGQF